MEHYRCWNGYIPSTKHERDVLTANFFPAQSPFLSFTCNDYLTQVAKDMYSLFTNSPALPSGHSNHPFLLALQFSILSSKLPTFYAERQNRPSIFPSRMFQVLQNSLTLFLFHFLWFNFLHHL
jgi:hypothetical protein